MSSSGTNGGKLAAAANGQRKRTSLKDLAAYLGLSQTTVSFCVEQCAAGEEPDGRDAEQGS